MSDLYRILRWLVTICLSAGMAGLGLWAAWPDHPGLSVWNYLKVVYLFLVVIGTRRGHDAGLDSRRGLPVPLEFTPETTVVFAVMPLLFCIEYFVTSGLWFALAAATTMGLFTGMIGVALYQVGVTFGWSLGYWSATGRFAFPAAS